MKVSINFTGRTQLDVSEVSARLLKTGEQSTVHVNWDLTNRTLPDDSFIVFEVYGAGQEKRSRIISPVSLTGDLAIDVSEFRDTNGLRSRTKIASSTGSFKLPFIHFVLDGISVENDSDIDRIKSILPIVKRPDIDSPWFLELNSDDANGPCLVIRENDGFADLMMDNPLFAPFVLPAIVSRVFEWVYEEREVPLETDVWESWRLFFTSLGVVMPKDFDALSNTDKKEIISENAIVASNYFSLKNGLIESAKRAIGESDD